MSVGYEMTSNYLIVILLTAATYGPLFPSRAIAAPCPVLIQRMGESNATRQTVRFQRSLQHLYDALQVVKSGPPDQQLRAIKDLRAKVMTVSELLEVYVAYYGKEVTPILKSLRELNHHVADAADLMHFASLFGVQSIPYPKTANRLIKAAERQQSELMDYLAKNEWTTKKQQALRDLITSVSDLPRLKLKRDQQFLRKSLLSGLDAIHEKTYPLEKVEEGLHELRKDVRSLLIIAQSAGGQILISERTNPIPETEPLLTSWVAKSKYARPALGEGFREVSNPIEISKGPFLQLVMGVEILGASKDLFQARNTLADALFESGEVTSKAEADRIANRIVVDSPVYRNLVAEYGDLLEAGRDIAGRVLARGGSLDVVREEVLTFKID